MNCNISKSIYKEKIMRKKKNEIFVAIKEDIINNAKSYFIVLIIFAVGVFLGVMFINQMQEKSKIEQYINTYVDETKVLQNGDYLGELQNDIRNHEFDNTFSKNSIKRIISLKVKGVIENNNFHVTSKYVPMIGNVVTLTTKDELNLIYGIYKNELTINIGKSNFRRI